MTPRYLGPFVRVADLPGRRALGSAVTNRLTVPAAKYCLPEEITSVTSLSTFQRHLKTFLFGKSFADIIAN